MRKFYKIGIFLLILFSASQCIFAKTVIKYVGISNAVLREKASTTSKKACVLDYGTSVEVLQEKGKWSLVQAAEDSSKKGWITTTQLTKKKISKNSNVSANTKEIALAGKGFASNLEENMAEDLDFDYSFVNVVEKNAATETEVLAFMEEGKLTVGE